MQRTVIRVRAWLYVLMVAFGLVGTAMLLQKIWICARSNAWHYSPNVQCLVGKTIGYISLTGMCPIQPSHSFEDPELCLVSRRSSRRYDSDYYLSQLSLESSHAPVAEKIAFLDFCGEHLELAGRYRLRSCSLPCGQIRAVSRHYHWPCCTDQGRGIRLSRKTTIFY